jgi:3-phenylpropionate/trans-cinnamate dioxygenase ferredoxin reductase subunit
MQNGLVAVGAGQAALQLAISLREGGWEAPITLIGDEPGLPYQRPPLSKAFLKGNDDAESLAFRPASYFARLGVTLRADTRVTGIDRTARHVRFDGGSLAYDRLVLATGARNRALRLPGADGAAVLSLRGVADALALREAVRRGGDWVVIGGGFLGLEVASTIAAAGRRVCVIEAAERLMARAISPTVSAYFLQRHRALGADIRLGCTVTSIEAGGVRTMEGEVIPAHNVLVAVGVLPNTELAEAAGLAVDNGIIVDHALRTADPAIYAIGDCALHPNPHAGGMARLESVQNAIDHARCAAAHICGKEVRYEAVPWFWSDQAGARLQIAGLTADADAVEVKGDADAFSVFCSRNGHLVGVESVNRPADHARARKMLSAGG